MDAARSSPLTDSQLLALHRFSLERDEFLAAGPRGEGV